MIKRANGTNICTECGHSWPGGTNTRTPFADAPAPVAAWSWKRYAPEERFPEIWSISASSPPASNTSDTLLFRQVTLRRDSQPSTPSLKWCRGGLLTARQRPLLRGMSLFYYDLWNEYSDMEVRKEREFQAYDINPIIPTPDSVSYPK